MRIPILTFVYNRKKTATKCKPASVELLISLGRERKYMATGVKLLPKEWKDGAVICREDWHELNNQLQIIKRRCSEIVTEMLENNNLDIAAIPTLLKDKMRIDTTFIEFARGFAEQIYTRVTLGTKKRYLVFLNFMDTWKRIIHFADVTEKNIKLMDEYLQAKGLRENSRWNYHKAMKVFIRRAIEEGLIKSDPYQRLKIGRGQNKGLDRVLTPEEFHRFENAEISVKKLDRVRDLFVFQTYTCLSYSDLRGFDINKCIEVNGRQVYKGQRTKTGQPFVAVITPACLSVLAKYGGKLPIISNVKYNEYLKVAITCAGIDKPVTSHWARHTGATLLLNEGNLPMHIVQRILGHATIRETERTYAKVLDETIVETMSNYL